MPCVRRGTFPFFLAADAENTEFAVFRPVGVTAEPAWMIAHRSHLGHRVTLPGSRGIKKEAAGRRHLIDTGFRTASDGSRGTPPQGTPVTA